MSETGKSTRVLGRCLARPLDDREIARAGGGLSVPDDDGSCPPGTYLTSLQGGLELCDGSGH